MIITLAEAMQRRKAELRGRPKASDCAVEAEKHLVRDGFLRWLDIELPEGTKVDIGETHHPNGYRLDIKLPNAEHTIFFRRTLILHEGYVCVWPFSTEPLWKTRRRGITRNFHDFIDAALYACGEATVDESGNLELRV